ncbi:MAG TPA: PEGA domain-containing protein, partial [Polyangiaceae bacterium]
VGNYPRRLASAVHLMVMAVVAPCLGGCTFGLRSAVTVHMARVKTTPRDASVYIDEEFIGPLYYVAAHGVRLPTGKHRVSITKDGYFPWDRLVEADRQPISLQVDLVRIPD